MQHSVPASALLLAQLLSLDPLLSGKLEVESEAGCWIWTGYAQKSGYKNAYGPYGRLKRKGKLWFVHRWVFWLVFGSVPPGAELHHRIPEGDCTSTLCCNPRHLEALDSGEHSWIHREVDGYET
jgi:hypothetical protein